MILYRYILREHVGPFIYSLVSITFLFVLDFLVTLLDRVLSKGVSFWVVGEIFMLNLAWIVALSVPMSFLVSSLMVFGRMSGDNEITALKSAGLSPLKIIAAPFLVSVAFTLVLVWFNDKVLPEANHRAAALMVSVSRKNPTAFIEEGRLIRDFPNVQLWISKINHATGKLYGVQIYDVGSADDPKFIQADSAFIEYKDYGRSLLLNLYHGETHIGDKKDPKRYFRIVFENQEFAMDNVDDSFERSDRNYRSDREMSIADMQKVVDDARETKKNQMERDAADIFRNLKNIGGILESDTRMFSHLYVDKVVTDSVVVDSIASDSATGYSNQASVPNQAMHRRRRNSVEPSDIKWFEVAFPVSFIQREITRENRLIQRINRSLENQSHQEKRAAQFLVEIHKKYSIPFACIVFVLVGAPLGIMARKGGVGVGIMYSIAFYIIYWAGLIGGENLGDRLVIRPWIAMWTPNLIIGLAGLLLLRKVIRDNYSGKTFWQRLKWTLQKWRTKKV
jgi:lipopolysaccharide export system permease protein